MDYLQKLGLERVMIAEGLAAGDLRFIGMLDFLERDMRVRKVQRIGLDNMLYEIQIAGKMDGKTVKGLFKEHCFPEPTYFNEIVVGRDLKNYFLIFEVNGHLYRIIVQNPDK